MILKVDPAYSEEARVAKISATVLLQIVVGADGLANNVKVLRDPGFWSGRQCGRNHRQMEIRSRQEGRRPGQRLRYGRDQFQAPVMGVAVAQQAPPGKAPKLDCANLY